jgi:xanthine dehydrogenase YagS FAD-binding subunit
MCVALAALDATVRVAGPDGERGIPMTMFHRLPGDTPQIETQLQPNELIIAVDLPVLVCARRSLYRKVRDRASYAFALVSVAAALDIDDGVIREARVALGGVAAKPWRAHAAENVLTGARASFETFRRAAEAEMAEATGFRDNAFKIELARRTIAGVLSELAGKEAQS